MNTHTKLAQTITDTIDRWGQRQRSAPPPSETKEERRRKELRVKRALAELEQAPTNEARRRELMSARNNFGTPSMTNQALNVLGYRRFNHAGHAIKKGGGFFNGFRGLSSQRGSGQQAPPPPPPPLRKKRPTSLREFVASISKNLNSQNTKGNAELNAIAYYHTYLRNKKNSKEINGYYTSILVPKSDSIKSFMNKRPKSSTSSKNGLNLIKELFEKKKNGSSGSGSGSGGVVVAPVIGGPPPAPVVAAPAQAPIIIQQPAAIPQIKVNVPPAQTQFATQTLPPMERAAIMNAGGYGRATNAIMNAGGPVMIDRGIRALQTSGGNVRRASLNSGLPMRVFENINKLGGPVTARRTVVAVKKVSKKVKGGKKMKVKSVALTRPTRAVSRPTRAVSRPTRKRGSKKTKRPAPKKKQVLSARQKVKTLIQQIPRTQLEKNVFACVFPGRQ